MIHAGTWEIVLIFFRNRILKALHLSKSFVYFFLFQESRSALGGGVQKHPLNKRNPQNSNLFGFLLKFRVGGSTRTPTSKTKLLQTFLIFPTFFFIFSKITNLKIFKIKDPGPTHSPTFLFLSRKKMKGTWTQGICALQKRQKEGESNIKHRKFNFVHLWRAKNQIIILFLLFCNLQTHFSTNRLQKCQLITHHLIAPWWHQFLVKFSFVTLGTEGIPPCGRSTPPRLPEWRIAGPSHTALGSPWGHAGVLKRSLLLPSFFLAGSTVRLNPAIPQVTQGTTQGTLGLTSGEPLLWAG